MYASLSPSAPTPTHKMMGERGISDLSYDPVGQQNAWEWDRDRSRPKCPVLGDLKTAEKVQKYRHGGGGGNYRAWSAQSVGREISRLDSISRAGGLTLWDRTERSRGSPVQIHAWKRPPKAASRTMLPSRGGADPAGTKKHSGFEPWRLSPNFHCFLSFSLMPEVDDFLEAKE